MKNKLPKNFFAFQRLLKSDAIKDPAARKEYTRLRNIMRKRYLRFRGTKYQNWAQDQLDKLPQLKDIKSNEEFSAALNTAFRASRDKKTTLKGMKNYRKKSIARLQLRGLNSIDESNFDDFSTFMQYARESSQELFNSERSLKMWHEHVQKHGNTKFDLLEKIFDKWLMEQKENL